jgi:antitoxin component YwqK of YwqJK toxin-antitoxin module
VELHGTLKIWNANKKLIKHEKYKNGELIDKKLFFYKSLRLIPKVFVNSKLSF